MTPERWQEIQALFDAALEQPREGRTLYLKTACQNDETLFEEVLALLETYDDDPSFLEDSAASFHALVEPAPLEGQHIGAYRIVKRIGTGGMGAVYLAERDDEQFRKRVALKIVKRGMDTEEILRRFRGERQILAALDHSGIARLLDGGMTEDGRPYFVMEYVEGGEAINTYCDRKRLGVAERLQLFQQVCATLQFAHQNLVVHRDLKPSNILVSEQGQVKLLDFGIAKLLNPDLAPFTLAQTRTEMRLMTPEYAAPEQVRGEAITTATDVYQLGVLLYTLLTGHRPYRLKSRATEEIARAICEETPERPSTMVRRTSEVSSLGGTTRTITPDEICAARNTEVDRLVRRLSGDLDTIVLKAMHKEPQRRYISAEALGDDVHRYLVGLPVKARPDTVGYRTRKFIQRHRTGVGLATLVFLLVLGFGVLMAIQRAEIAQQAQELEQERDRAQLEMKKSEEVTAFLVDLFKGSDPNQAQGMTAREMLDQGAEKIRVELEAQPVVKAQLLTVIGGVYRTLGLYEEAQDALDEAIVLFRETDPHADQFASSLLERANLHYRVDEYEAAEPLLHEAVVIKTELFGPDDPEVAQVLNTLALVLEYTSGFEASIEVMERVVAIRRQQPAEESRASLPVNLSNLANQLHSVGRLDEAEPLYRESIQLAEETRGPEHPYVAIGLNSLAALHQDRDEFEAAEQAFSRAWDIAVKSLGETHPFTAVVAHNRGKLYHAQGRYEEAIEHLGRAVSMYRDHIASPLDLAESLHWLGLVHVDAERAPEAEPMLREALTIHESLLSPSDWRIAQSKVQLGRCLSQQQRFVDAEPFIVEGISTLQEERGLDHAVTQKALQYVIDHFRASGQEEQAATYQAMRMQAPITS